MIAAKRTSRPKPRARSVSNPLTVKWNGGFAMPPFDKIEVRHFKPALEAAFREHKAEIEKIASNRAKPTFANTILALEKSGWQLSRSGLRFLQSRSLRLDARDAGGRARNGSALRGPRNTNSARQASVQTDRRSLRAPRRLETQRRRPPRSRAASPRVRSSRGPLVAGRKIPRQGDQRAPRDPRDAVHAERPEGRAILAARSRRRQRSLGSSGRRSGKARHAPQPTPASRARP